MFAQAASVNIPPDRTTVSCHHQHLRGSSAVRIGLYTAAHSCRVATGTAASLHLLNRFLLDGAPRNVEVFALLDTVRPLAKCEIIALRGSVAYPNMVMKAVTEGGIIGC